MRLWHWIGVGVALAVAVFSVFQHFPNEAECIASGRTVDATRRHCEGPDGYVTLREHAMWHTREPILFIVIVGGIVYFVRRRRTRTRANGTPRPNASNEPNNP